ncbi:MAG: OmpH family outer membrane protein [Novosphingobium sp.]
MNILLKSAVAAGLMLGGSQLVLAQPRPAVPVTTATQVVPGLGVANVDAIVGNSNAFKVAQTQRPATYKAQFDAAEARRSQIAAQLQPMVDKFNRDRAAPTANTPAGQTSLQQQAQTIQSIQQSGQAELQKLLVPVALSEAYVQEQIGDKLNAAIQAAMTKKNITLVLTPQSVLAATNAYNLNQQILDELNVTIPSAQLVPPAGWEPREVRDQKAAQAAQQSAAPAGRPAPGGR